RGNRVFEALTFFGSTFCSLAAFFWYTHPRPLSPVACFRHTNPYARRRANGQGTVVIVGGGLAPQS
ncbi:MAG TPA: hypothetical protein VE977_17865, partial [Pyrinomonadaceae bacterium]|nr:hypothetical protein [Pyrinomonadaceae bacterium]